MEKRKCSICGEVFETDKDYISCPAHSFEETTTSQEKPKLERCHVCGDFSGDPRLYTENEQLNAEITYCGCQGEEHTYVTHDMAIDAGDLSLEGQQLS